MKWGKRNGPPYPLSPGDHSASEKKAGWRKSLANNGTVMSDIRSSGHYIRNADKLQSDPDHNCVYITGLSGSGKSTIAEKFRNANKIHLDFYFEKGDPNEDLKYQDREFNDFMSTKGIKFGRIKDLPNRTPEKWKAIDEFGDAITEFSRQQYKKGKLVVVEGVQLADQTLYPDKSFFDDKCLVVLQTSSVKSLYRGLQRDGINPFDVLCIAERIKNNQMWSKNLKALKRRKNLN